MSILSRLKKEFSAEEAERMQKIVEERKKAKAAEKARKQHAKEILKRIDQEEYEKAKAEREASERMEKVREARERTGTGKTSIPALRGKAKKAEQRARVEAILRPYRDMGDTVLVYTGERIMFHVPSGVVQENGWKNIPALRFLSSREKSHCTKLGKITRPTKSSWGTLGSSIPVRVCEDAGWRDGMPSWCSIMGAKLYWKRWEPNSRNKLQKK